MEQKAVVYKNLKGMARDIAMSSGNNDFSYENYNIRITTRGKEDSLVVTNEKGTESNIIATKDVLKTVNNIFVGMQPGFYNNFTALEQSDDIRKYDYTELYKKIENEYIQLTQEEYFDDEIIKYKRVKRNEIQQLTSANGIIKYSLNTEYPTDNSELKAKGIFSITETPITYKDEKLFLLNDGKYSTDTQIIIPENNNTFLAIQNIKDIVLNGDSSETATDVEDIKNKKWLDTYKNLYRRIIEKNFEFAGFDSRMNDISYVNSENLNQIPIDIISNGLTLPTGEFTPDNVYAGGNGVIEDGEDDNKYLKVDIPQISYLTGGLFTKQYPTNAKLKIKEFSQYIYVPFFKKWVDGDTYDQDAKYYDITPNNGVVTGSIYPKSDVTSDNYKNYYKEVGYIKLNFDFDIKKFFGNTISKNAISINKKEGAGSETTLSGTASLDYNFYSVSNPDSACFSINISVTLGSNYCYYNPGGPFFKGNIVEQTSSPQSAPQIYIGNRIEVFSSSEGEKTLSVSGSYFMADGSNISYATDGTNNGYRFKNNGTEQNPQYDYKTVEHISNNTVDKIYNVIGYELYATQSESNYVEISKIETEDPTYLSNARSIAILKN